MSISHFSGAADVVTPNGTGVGPRNVAAARLVCRSSIACCWAVRTARAWCIAGRYLAGVLGDLRGPGVTWDRRRSGILEITGPFKSHCAMLDIK